MRIDCDNDTLLILANSVGDTCHLGQKNCFGTTTDGIYFLKNLEKTIQERKSSPKKDSYTSSLFASGINKISQKVGEEGVEVVIAALGETKERLASESADLLFHLLVLLAAREIFLDDVLRELKDRQ
jgi:phosphoribosyl-ATP pyrophosphohydrolase/phosphoribosyl-AMP cyclohydrolase